MVERLTMEVGGTPGVVAAGRPSSAISMASSPSVEESDRSSSERGGNWVRGGRIGPALHSL